MSIAVALLDVRVGHPMCLGGRDPVHAAAHLRHHGPVHHRGLRPVLAAEAPHLDGRGQTRPGRQYFQVRTFFLINLTA